MSKPSAAPLLAIQNLHITVEGAEVVRGVSLMIGRGEVHAIMGPNGSGKSTLVNALMGHPKYTITDGRVAFAGKDLLARTPDERARSGLFLAFQYPKEIAGVSVRSFLLAAYNAQRGRFGGKKMSPLAFQKELACAMRELKMDPSFAERSLNQGFSGGEKKKAEILQLSILRPLLALLDETDSGLDVDALKIVAEGVAAMRGPDFSALLVTHYARILEHLQPDHVHVMVGGKIVDSGGKDLAKKLEKEGYAAYGTSGGKIALE